MTDLNRPPLSPLDPQGSTLDGERDAAALDAIIKREIGIEDEDVGGAIEQD